MLDICCFILYFLARNHIEICYFILYFLTRNHIEIEMARKYTDPSLSGTSSLSNSFCEFIFDYNLTQHVMEPTHIMGNIVVANKCWY